MGRFGLLVCIAALGCGAWGALALGAAETGSPRADHLLGTKGDDLLKGLKGRDVLHGGGGRDVLIGGRGLDSLHGDGGHDSFNMRDGVQLAAKGRDRIYARDGHPDEINCGAGRDLAVVDEVEDGVYDCEVVTEP
jgi:Ca2+-binding RTX toxin-like protein